MSYDTSYDVYITCDKIFPRSCYMVCITQCQYTMNEGDETEKKNKQTKQNIHT